MEAELITIGDEILIGQVINTNAAYIGEKLLSIGIRLSRVTTIGDNETGILAAISKSFEDYPVILVTGGLGPTHDDITKKVLAKYFHSELKTDNEVLKHIKKIFQKRKIEMKPINEEQALVPECCKVLFNHFGTAPGMHFEKDGKEMFVMPGVPHEMKHLMDKKIIPYLSNKSKYFIKTKTLLTTGIPESTLFTALGDINELTKNAELAFLPSPRGVKIRIMTKDLKEEAALNEIQRIENIIRKKAGEFIFGEGSIEIEEILKDLLIRRNLKIAVVESCTGGMISNRITNVPGCSEYFDRGIITYSNSSKIQEVDVSPDILNKMGAVSEEVAIEMAEGARKKANVDIAISTTGIAGPTGGTPAKPVGMVCIGYSDKYETFAKTFFLGDNRLVFKERTSQMALDILRKYILKNFQEIE